MGQLLSEHTDEVTRVVFSPDGKTLASSSLDKTIILRDVDVNPQLWIQRTCERVGRNFTRAEWAQYFPNEEYRKTCEQWPLEPEIIATPSPTP